MRKLVVMLLSALLLIASCSSYVNIQSTWKQPGAVVDMNKIQKVLVVVLLKNEGSRRAAEDKLVSLLKGKGVASYQFLTGNVDSTALAQKFKDEGINGAIVMRLLSIENGSQYVAGDYNTYPGFYGGFWGYYDMAYDNFSDPGYYVSTKTYKMETNIYSLKESKLLWTGISSIIDPSNLDDYIGSSATAIYRRMQDEGFILN